MSETSPTIIPNTEPISDEEAVRRVDALLKLDDEIMPYLLVERATELPDGEPEINAIHAMRGAIMTLAYYLKFPNPNVDPYRAAVDWILHDFLEGRANDVATLTATKERLAQKAADEARALDELYEEIGEDWPELLNALHEYEEQLLPRTRAVRLFDKADPSYTHLKNQGATLHALGVHSAARMSFHDSNLSERFAQHRAENPDLAKILDELRSRVAKVAFNGWEQSMIQFDE